MRCNLPAIHEVSKDLIRLIYPRYCAGCSSLLVGNEPSICTSCLHQLSSTHFYKMEDNPVSKTFWGRIKIEAALSRYHFIKSSKIQSILHELKYKGNQELGNVLGRMVANYIKQANYFPTIDFIIPVPLHPKKHRIRGYNQSTLIAQGVSNGLGAPINDNTLLRSLHTKTQTKKGRIARWQNVSDAFALAPKHGLEGKSVLLVDDVVTTGATLEACGAELLKISGLKLSIAAVAYA